LNELNGGAGSGNVGGGSNAGSGSGNGGNVASYYEHGGFPSNTIVTSADIYDSIGTISTMTQAQTSHLYTPPIGGSIGQSIFPVKLFQPFIHISFTTYYLIITIIFYIFSIFLTYLITYILKTTTYNHNLKFWILIYEFHSNRYFK
jgi:hypothetical protein